jgi:hypothetical protein
MSGKKEAPTFRPKFSAMATAIAGVFGASYPILHAPWDITYLKGPYGPYPKIVPRYRRPP